MGQHIDGRVDALRPVHRDRAWRDRLGYVWSWSADRGMWLNEFRGEADRDAWRSQEYMNTHGRHMGPFTLA